MTRVNKKCFQLNLGWKRTSRKHFSASAFISRSRPSASTSKMALASKTFSLMSFFNLGFNWKNFSFTLVPFFLTVFYNNFDNKILFLHWKCKLFPKWLNFEHDLTFFYVNYIIETFFDILCFLMKSQVALMNI